MCVLQIRLIELTCYNYTTIIFISLNKEQNY